MESKKSKVILIVIIGLLTVAVASLGVVMYQMSRANEKALSEADGKYKTASASITKLTADGKLKDADISTLEGDRSELSAERDRLTAELEALNSRIAELEKNLEDAGGYYSGMIEQLKNEVAEKQKAIEILEEDISKYSNVFNVDVLAQAQLIDEINKYIENDCPYVRRDFINDEGKEDHEWLLLADLVNEERELASLNESELYTDEELRESGLGEEELTELKLRERVFAREGISKAKIGIYYEDVLTGYHFGYNEKERFPYASVIKAPYVTAVLQSIVSDEKAYTDRLLENGEYPELADSDGDGIGDKVKIEYSKPEYNIYETVVYDPETMKKDGSGVIKDMEAGVEFTYAELMTYAIKESDNVAYSLLRERYGFDPMYDFAASVGASIQKSSLSAEDTGKMFREIWNFCRENVAYGSIVYEAMRTANHTVMIPYALSSKTVLHKYGWDKDSYHDAGIVISGDRPYVIAVFTNMDNGDNTVNSYIRGLIKKIDALHNGFTA